MKKNQQTISLPQESVRNLFDAVKNIEQFQDEIEDFLLFQNSDFLKKIRQAKIENEKEKTISWIDFKKKYV